MGNFTSRTITGVVMIIVGIGLFVPYFFGIWFTLLYAVPLLIIGLFILFNKKEDKIEEIKSKQRSKK